MTVTFEGYPFRGFVESFGDFVVGSRWLAAVTQDYGPVSATHIGKYVLPAPPNGAGSDFGALLQANLAAGNLPFPSDPTGLVFLVYAPLPCGGGGFHSSFFHAGVPVAYAVGLNCQDALSAEGVMTHEIAEAASDPFNRGYFFDTRQLPWIGEVADICNFAPWWIENGFRFVGIWSNTAAAGGGSPCVPRPETLVYTNVSPSPAEPQTVDAGASVDFVLTGWSTAPTRSWSLITFPDGNGQQDFDATPVLSRTTIQNGEVVTLTLHVPSGTPPGAQATIRIGSLLPFEVAGVRGFMDAWSVQVRAR